MMTPLSIRDAQNEAVDSITGADTPARDEAPEHKLDSMIDRVYDRITGAHREEVPQRDLDGAIGSALDKKEKLASEREEFDRSREVRSELQSRYPQGNFPETCNQFLTWAGKFKQNPQRAADEFATSYLLADRYAADAPKKAAVTVTADADEHPWKKLDKILDAAIDDPGIGDNFDFNFSASQRAEIKKLFPGLSFDAALDRIAKIDRDMHTDPLGTAERLAIVFGAPATRTQQEAVQAQAEHQHQHSAMTAIVNEMKEHLPGLQQLEEEVGAILQHPQFVHLPDPRQNLARAHRIAVLQAAERQRSERTARAERARGVKSSGTMPSGASQQSGLDGILSAALGG